MVENVSGKAYLNNVISTLDEEVEVSTLHLKLKLNYSMTMNQIWRCKIIEKKVEINLILYI